MIDLRKSSRKNSIFNRFDSKFYVRLSGSERRLSIFFGLDLIMTISSTIMLMLGVVATFKGHSSAQSIASLLLLFTQIGVLMSLFFTYFNSKDSKTPYYAVGLSIGCIIVSLILSILGIFRFIDKGTAQGKILKA